MPNKDGEEGVYMKVVAGIDIGGTKCAVSFARPGQEGVEILSKVRMKSKRGFEEAMQTFIEVLRDELADHPQWELAAIGISCGGPLDSRRGLVLSPPNLPDWDGVDCFTPLRRAFGVPVALQNDADACALAEWRWGAGRGCSDMVFLTFGTGMGAGLILGGRLYIGSRNLAGEVGHVRLAETGPEGYGKEGSFEGFCSGGGIARLGRQEAERAIREGNPPLFCRTLEELPQVTAKSIAQALEQGDPLALSIYQTVGRYLGRGLAMLIDVLNPELIVIGSIYGRQRDVLEPVMREEIAKEALSASAKSCRIEPAGLGEMVGDYAALSVAFQALEEARRTVLLRKSKIS